MELWAPSAIESERKSDKLQQSSASLSAIKAAQSAMNFQLLDTMQRISPINFVLWSLVRPYFVCSGIFGIASLFELETLDEEVSFWPEYVQDTVNWVRCAVLVVLFVGNVLCPLARPHVPEGQRSSTTGF